MGRRGHKSDQRTECHVGRVPWDPESLGAGIGVTLGPWGGGVRAEPFQGLVGAGELGHNGASCAII